MESPDGCAVAAGVRAGAVAGDAPAAPDVSRELTEDEFRAAVDELARGIALVLRELAASEREAA